MKKYWVAIAVVIMAIVMGVVIYSAMNQKEKTFNKVNLKSSNFLINITGRTYLDTIVLTGLKFYGIDSTQIVVRDLPAIYNQNQENGTELKAFILNQGSQYLIYIKNANRNESISILAHELIHFKQYHDKRLSVYEDTYFIWNGKNYSNKTEYNSRPWEIEAFGMADGMEVVLKQQLYGNNSIE